MEWFGVRRLYHFGTTAEGQNIFEERIVAFCGETPEVAHEKADREAAEYARFHGFVAHPAQEAYKQDGEALIDGYEVWSMLYESPLTLEAFYEEHYTRHEYRSAELPAPPPLPPAN